MAQRTQEEWSEYDSTRFLFAVEEIAASANLRFFFRALLSATGLQQPLPDGNALTTARAAGRHDIGLEILGMLERDPTLWPNLILEDLNELRERLSA